MRIPLHPLNPAHFLAGLGLIQLNSAFGLADSSRWTSSSLELEALPTVDQLSRVCDTRNWSCTTSERTNLVSQPNGDTRFQFGMLFHQVAHRHIEKCAHDLEFKSESGSFKLSGLTSFDISGRDTALGERKKMNSFMLFPSGAQSQDTVLTKTLKACAQLLRSDPQVPNLFFRVVECDTFLFRFNKWTTLTSNTLGFCPANAQKTVTPWIELLAAIGTNWYPPYSNTTKGTTNVARKKDADLFTYHTWSDAVPARLAKLCAIYGSREIFGFSNGSTFECEIAAGEGRETNRSFLESIQI